MALNTQKEDFSYAYVYGVAAAAGYSLQSATRQLDNSGIDATITVPGTIGSKRLPRSSQSTITVEIPRHNIFNVDALCMIMQRIAAGDVL